MFRLLLGRSRELADVEAAFERAEAGHGNVFLISGEPGIGKTRLAEEAAEIAERRGAAVHWGRAWEVEGAPACWPWVQVLRACSPEGRLHGLAARPANGSAEIDLVREAATIVELFGRLSRERPLVVIFDDLHASDVASLTVLNLVAQELHDLRVLVVGTYRDLEARRVPRVASLIARIARLGTVRPLGRLDEDTVALWVAGTLGVAPTSALVAAVFAATEGNPLFVDAVAHLLAARGRSDGALAAFGLPDSTREAVQELLAPIPLGARSVLDTAAVLGRECPMALLQVVCALPVDDVLAALDVGVAAGVLSPQPRPSSPVRFTHVLVREAVYQPLPVAVRMDLHGSAARALKQMYAAELDDHLAEIAHHAFESAPVASWQDAFELLARAGQRAMNVSAFDDAAHHFERALVALDHTQGDDDGRRAELLGLLGVAQIRIGQSRAGRESCERSAALAERTGRTDLYARAALAFGLEVAYSSVDARLIELLETALRFGPSEPLRAQVMARLGAAMIPSLTPERPRALAREAVAVARALGDRRVLAQVMATARSAFMPPMPLDEITAMDREIVALAAELGDRLLAVQTYGRMALIAMVGGDADEVKRNLRRQGELADELRVPEHQVRAAALRLLWATVTDDDEGFAKNERRILELSERVDSSSGLFSLEVNRMARAELRGDFVMAREIFERAQSLAPPNAHWTVWGHPVWRASLLADAGKLDEARAALAKLPPHIATFVPMGAVGSALLARVARLAVEVDDKERMRAIYELLLPRAAQFALNLAFPVCEGPVAYYLGRLAAGLGRPDEAAAFFRDALARCERAGMSAFSAQARDALDALARPIVSVPQRVERPPRMEREGELWSIWHEGRQLRLKDSKGMGYLAILLGEPGRDFHVAHLIAGDGDGDRGGGGATVVQGDAGELLDARARAAYRERLEILDDAHKDAEERSDSEALSRIRHEREALADELARAVGLGGRSRKAGSHAERARINVQRRLRDAVNRIAEVDEPLGRYLRLHVRTGAFCCMEP